MTVIYKHNKMSNKNLRKKYNKALTECAFWRRKVEYYAPNRMDQHYKELEEELRKAGFLLPEGEDHVRVQLSNGASARVSPDASPEMIAALDNMVGLAAKMMDFPFDAETTAGMTMRIWKRDGLTLEGFSSKGVLWTIIPSYLDGSTIRASFWEEGRECLYPPGEDNPGPSNQEMEWQMFERIHGRSLPRCLYGNFIACFIRADVGNFFTIVPGNSNLNLRYGPGQPLKVPREEVIIVSTPLNKQQHENQPDLTYLDRIIADKLQRVKDAPFGWIPTNPDTPSFPR